MPRWLRARRRSGRRAARAACCNPAPVPSSSADRADDEQRRAAVERGQQDHGDGHEHAAGDRPGPVAARRATSRPVTRVPKAAPNMSGMSTRPDRVGLISRTCCTNWGTKKIPHHSSRPLVKLMPARRAHHRVARRAMSGSTGSGARRSRRTNSPPSSTTSADQGDGRGPSRHGISWPPRVASRTNSARPEVSSAAPAQSRACGMRRYGRRRRVATMVPPPARSGG